MKVKELIEALKKEDPEKDVLMIEPVHTSAQPVSQVTTGLYIDDGFGKPALVEDTEDARKEFPEAQVLVAIN